MSVEGSGESQWGGGAAGLVYLNTLAGGGVCVWGG